VEGTRVRDLRRYWLAGAADLLGSHATGLVFPLVVLAVGAGPVAAGALGTVSAVGRFAAAPLAGVHADRRPRRALMTGSALVAAATLGLVAAGVATGRASWPVLLVAALVEGVAAAVYAAAAAGAVRRLLPPADPERAVAALRARDQGAELVGPTLGGVLYQVTAWAPFLADAASYLVAAVLVRSIHTDLGPDRPSPSTVRGDLSAGLRFVWTRPFLRFVVLWAAGVNLLLGALYVDVVLTARLHGASAAAIGFVLSASGAAGLAGSLAAPWLVRRLPAPVLVVGVSWLLPVLVVLLGPATGTWRYGAVLAAVAFVSPALSVVFGTRAILTTPDGFQARVGTVLGTLGEGAASFAPLLAGVLVGFARPGVVAVTFGAALAALAVYATANRAQLRPAAAEPVAVGR
jgi:predicted MFS family arabinose efflux permease